MSEITDRMKLVYPSVDDESWHPLIESMMNSIDVELFELIEQSNVMMLGGGNLSWTLSTQLLEWDEDIVFVVPSSGVVQRIAPSSLEIAESEFVVVELVFEPVTSTLVGMFAAASLGVSGQSKVVAFRDGDEVKFITGLNLEPGDTSESGVLP